MIPKELIFFIAELADFSEFLPILFFILFGRIRQYKFLFFGLLAHSILELYTFYLAIGNHYNLDVYHLIGGVELIYVYLFYKSLYPVPKGLKYGFFVILTIYIFNSYYFELHTEHINAYGRSFSSLYLMILGLYYLFYIYKEEAIDNISSSTPFWINAGFIIYFATSFFAFLFSRKILSYDLTPTSLFGSMWIIHTISDIIRSIIIALALSLKNKTNSPKYV